MTAEKFLKILERAAKLKVNTRHNWTEADRKESVADHSWRVALMAMLLDGVEEFESVDIDRVIRMCIIHDLGEAFTGDVPSFEKTGSDEKLEEEAFDRWVAQFPEPQRSEWQSLLSEMKALQTAEAKLYKCLDKMEALISHDEADISTWLPIEYELQLTYGVEEAQFSEYAKLLKETIDDITRQKIADAKGIAKEN